MAEEHVTQPADVTTAGRRVQLASITPTHYAFLHQLYTDPAANFRWRFRGTTPAPDAFESALWDGVLAQFLVVAKDSGEMMGLVTAYGADLRNGHVHVALILAPKFRGIGWPFEAAVLFANFLFVQWPLRKLYSEVAGYNYALFATGLGRYFTEEGRLLEHEYHDGRYWDVHLLALARQDWEVVAPRLLAWLSGAGDGLTPPEMVGGAVRR